MRWLTNLLVIFLCSTAFAGQNITGDLYVTGNTGLGVTTPQTKLFVNGQIRTVLTGSKCVETDANGILVSAAAACGSGGGGGFFVAGNVGINTTSNVGIGTVNPGKELDVVGSIRASSGIGIGSYGVCTTSGNCPSGGAAVVGANPTASVGLTVVNGSAGTFLRSDGSPALSQSISPVWTGNHVFSPASGDTAIIAGNLGIGTVTPARLLDLRGSQYITGNLGIGTTLSTNKFEVVGGVGIGTSYAGYKAAPANGMIIEGNVGIGTFLTPRLLNLFSDASIDSTGVLRLNRAATNTSIILTGDSGTTRAKTIQFLPGTVTATLSAYSQGFTSLVGYDRAASMSMVNDSAGGLNFAATNSAGPISFWSGNGTAFESMRLNPDGNLGVGTTTPQARAVFIGGNVGIGTWTASRALDVIGNINASGTLGGSNFSGTSSGTNTGDQTSVSGNAGTVTFADAGGDTTTFFALGTSATGSLAPATDSTLTYNATTDVMSIPSITTTANVGIGTVQLQNGLAVMSGNVGIGTWAATQMLEVNGTVKAAALITSGNIGIGTTQTQVGLAVMSGNVGIGTWAPTNSLIVKAGNVGIGTNNANQALQVVGTIDVTGFKMANGVVTGGVLQTDTNGVGTWVAPAGTVGVGTINTGAINNVAYYATAGIKLSGATGLLTNGTNVGIGTSAFQVPLAVMSGNVGIGTWAPQQALIVNGKVGIGTANPIQTLEVKGTFSVRGAQTSPFTMKSATNQACDTTCANSQCIAGQQLAGSSFAFLNCSDATADNCICAGP